MAGSENRVADLGTGRSGRFPATIALTAEEALDLLAAAEEAATALDRTGPSAISLELTNATTALIAALFRDFPTVSE